MLRLFPTRETYSFLTKLSVAEIHERLSRKIEPRKRFKAFPLSSSYKPYEGELFETTFSISKTKRRRNSTSPMINGVISHTGNQSRIDVDIRIHPVIIAFSFIWLFFAISAVLALLSGRNLPYLFAGIIGIIVVFGFINFRKECNEAKILFTDFLEATETVPEEKGCADTPQFRV